MKYLLLIFFLTLSSLSDAQQKEADNPISVDQLKEDLGILRRNLETVHPGLYTYISETAFDSIFSELERSIIKPMTDIEFYRFLAPLQSQIQNGHTMIIPAVRWSHEAYTSSGLFPFEVYLYHKEIYVLKNLSKNELIKPGTKIERINGKSSEEVINKLIRSITQDGKNETYPLQLLQEGFMLWYADIIGTPQTFKLIVSQDNQAVIDVSIKALTLDEIQANHLHRYQQEKVLWYQKEDPRKLSLEIEDNIGTLLIPTFDSGGKSEEGKKFKRFYKQAFKQIRESNVEHLILDLRNNGGGDPMPQLALLNHLIDKPLKLYNRTYAITEKIPNREYYKNDNISWLNFLLKSSLRQEDKVFVVKGGFLARTQGAPPRKEVSPYKNLYRGKLYVLINGGSFSATGEVAGLLKHLERGIFIGEETGGSDYQNSSGIMIMLHLPHSQTRINLPLLCFDLNVTGENDGRGTIPQHKIRPSIENILYRKDVVLEKAYELIKTGF